MLSSRIISVGGYLPKKILSNLDMEKLVDTTDEWIFTRSGIRNRHIAGDSEFTSDLASKALLDAMDKLDNKNVDGIIVATTTPDRIFPSVAAIVQNKMSLLQCMAVDINAVCSGFIYAMTIADSLIRTGALKRVAVIGSETMSRILDWNDRSTCVLFGDGAGAVILEESKENKLWFCDVMSDGSLNDILYVPSGVSEQSEEGSKIVMNGREVFRHAVDKMCSSAMKVISEAGISINDIDLLIPHQANARIISMVGEKLGIAKEKVIVTLENQGNTSAATIPLAINEAIKQNRLKRGMKVLLTAAGAGFTWGSILFEY